MILSLLALPLVLCSVAIDVTHLNGDVISGELVNWQGANLTITVDGEPVQLSTEQLLKIQFADLSTSTSPDIQRVTLGCGSSFAVRSFESTDGRVAITRTSGGAINCEQSQIQSIRFRPPSAAINPQWVELVNQRHEGDAIIIRKSDSALDYLEGIIGDVTSDKLQFELDGSEIDVKLTKLEGIVPYRTANDSWPAPICNIITTTGDRWHVDQATLDNDQLQIKTPCGVASRVALKDIARVDFAAGNVQYISDLEPWKVDITPLISGSASPSSVTAMLYAPRRDESLNGTPLMLRGDDGGLTSFTKGLAVHSRTTLHYRLDGQHRKLRGLVGIDPTVKAAAVVTLRIYGNEKLLLEAQITANEPPLTLDVSIEDVRRLKLEVDYGDGVDIGDRLNFGNLRTTK